MVSFDEAVAMVTGPGSLLEIGEAEVFGRPERIYTKIPGNLRGFFAALRQHGERTFLVYEDERYSFTEVSDAIAATAALLVDDYGIAPGDRVAIAMRNYPEWIIAFGAIVSIGAISVSLNSWWTADELDYALEDSGATLLIADQQRAELSAASAARLGTRIVGVRTTGPIDGVVRWEDVVVPGRPLPEVEVDPDSDATILYTSGTTGRPKGAVSTNRAVTQALGSFAARAAVDSVRGMEPKTPDGAVSNPPAFILIVPLFHVTGCVAVMLSCVISGTKLVMMYRWDPERALRADRARTDQPLRRCPDAELGSGRRTDVRERRHLEPAIGRWWGSAGTAEAGRQRSTTRFPSGSAEHRLRDDRDQRLRTAERRTRTIVRKPASTGRTVPPGGSRSVIPPASRCPSERLGEIWFAGRT